jgi:hypothetical protein
MGNAVTNGSLAGRLGIQAPVLYQPGSRSDRARADHAGAASVRRPPSVDL